MKSRLSRWIAGIALLTTSAHAGFVIGCFDTNRAGIFSPSQGSQETVFRSNIFTVFPGAAFQSTNTLTTNFLSAVNLLILTVAYGNTQGVAPLTAAEQSAVTNYVAQGGPALIFTDNDIQFESASESMVQPFGLDSTGYIAGSVNATVTNLTHPVANGPFGIISNYTVFSYPGWYDVVPTNAAAIAILNQNSQVSIAAMAPGAFSHGSGGIVFFSDSTIDNASFDGNLVPLVDNAIDYVLPPAEQSLPTLSIAETNNNSVVISWQTNFLNFRLQQSLSLSPRVWSEQSVTGPNQAVLPMTNTSAFFRLIRP